MWFTQPRSWPFIAAVTVLAAIGVTGCGQDDDLTGSGQVQTEKGFITGTAFLAGDAERTNQIVIRVLNELNAEEVDTTFPDDEGKFTSRGLDNGTYTVLASAPIPGYGVARRYQGAPVLGQERPAEHAPMAISQGAAAISLARELPPVFVDPPSEEPFGAAVFFPGIGFLAYDFDHNSDETGFVTIPPDPIGVAGKNHVVSVVNTSIEWFTKSGILQKSQRLGRNADGL